MSNVLFTSNKLGSDCDKDKKKCVTIFGLRVLMTYPMISYNKFLLRKIFGRLQNSFTQNRRDIAT